MLARVCLMGLVVLLPPVLADGARSTAAAPAGVELQDTGRVRLRLAPEGNEARYRVNEQLARMTLPSDAVGATTGIQGGIVLEADGRVVRDSSRIVIDLTTLKSDSDRRDNYVRRNTLETAQHPHATLVVRELRGLRLPLPATGQQTLQLVGDLTLHGVTRPTLWQVTARFDGRRVDGSARTALRFGDFRMEIPRVASVLSVQDSIRLEYDFAFIR